MAAGDGAQLPATIAASRSVEKALEEAAASGALNLSNRKLKEFPRTARNHDLSDITYAGELLVCLLLPQTMWSIQHTIAVHEEAEWSFVCHLLCFLERYIPC